MERVGIMGGTFNPPHIGHFIIAETVRQEMSLDKIIFIPTGRIGYKDASNVASAEDRCCMLNLVIRENPAFELSDIEIKNSKNYSYTANTLLALKDIDKNRDYYFIVGADSLDYMDDWYKPEIIFSNCRVVCANRPGISALRLKSKKEKLEREFGADITFVDIPQVGISSSLIRNRVAAGKSIKYLTDARIEEYILLNGLYRS